MRKPKLFSLTLFFIVSCATHKLTIRSQVENAKVEFLNQDSEWVQLGQTPLELDEKQLQAVRSPNNAYHYRVSKIGYNSEGGIIYLNPGAQVSIEANLKEVINWTDPDSKELMIVLDKFGQQIQAVNRLIGDKKIRLAQKEVNSLIDKYPKVALLYDLEGTLFLLKGKRELAKKSYLKSLEITPSNAKTRNFLKREFKIDVPPYK